MTIILVTVGTTQFDALVKAVVSREFLDVIAGESSWEPPIRLIVQHGSSAVPGLDAHHPAVFQHETFESFQYETVEVLLKPYINNLVSWIDRAELVVTHAGAGTLLEALRSQKHPRIMAVPNSDLMDDHQRELAEILYEENYVMIGEIA
ncbi:N-acetylglucosaminyldiphosphodolichol N-acetylglucosaminyltransferase [Malassezia psittaci]|uniref:UDP-N-acetylglucosamine transferase subunit ALG13 n=1 Tax=Malassezia psittaci TaxID=1821823 RepID=A0AAF0FAM7_9BASI|nr:N-acetylglucosaminyldiphosphodolichol N-acetylglucosaminyltransferase [Malassezia psittaci]